MLEQRASDLPLLEFCHGSYTNLSILVKQIIGVKSLKTQRSEPEPAAKRASGTEPSFSWRRRADGPLGGAKCCPAGPETGPPQCKEGPCQSSWQRTSPAPSDY
ncbi:hypothetical protein PBY51_014540 [Eleginops maclovinus]|uniref:Uncharacterized protein n=1 Tax=Eleginops maclovinus TaxID=56733 RepID=A0AAN7WVY3_ELEMC|nr:hypothetical protein PBY51_014540 [Eleginops maclovinus]